MMERELGVAAAGSIASATPKVHHKHLLIAAMLKRRQVYPVQTGVQQFRAVEDDVQFGVLVVRKLLHLVRLRMSRHALQRISTAPATLILLGERRLSRGMA